MLVAIALGLALVLFLITRSRSASRPAFDSTPVLEAWVRATLERELAKSVLGISSSTREERKKLAQTLADEPDPELVTRIEKLVRSVDLEYVKYAHEPDIGATLKVRFENGSTIARERRFSSAEVPAEVVTELGHKGTTRVFRSWTFSWQRVTTL